MDKQAGDSAYTRLMRSRKEEDTGYRRKELGQWVKRAQVWAKKGDVYASFISGAKVKNPAAAMAFMERVGR
ncbi:MAG: hypothetical protein Kow00114_14750 [Kiloniellaceae bacterium]